MTNIPLTEPKDVPTAPRWIPWALAAAILAVTLVSVQRISDSRGLSDQLTFDQHAARLENAIQLRLSVYVEALLALRGHLALKDSLTSEDFFAFAQQLDINKRFPGIQGLGFTLRVKPGATSQYQSLVLNTAGPTVEIHPQSETSDMYPVTFLHPLDSRNRAAVGFDMFSESARQFAMESARDSGHPVMTAPVVLRQETTPPAQPGVLMYVPLYEGRLTPTSVEERREKIRGFAYAPFRAGDLLSAIATSTKDEPIAFSVVDPTAKPESLLYRSPFPENYASRFTATKDIELIGRQWHIRFASLPAFDRAAEPSSEWWVLALGGCLSIISYIAAASRVRAHERVSGQKELLRVTLSSITDGVVATNRTGEILFLNKTAEHLLGVRETDARARPLKELLNVTPCSDGTFLLNTSDSDTLSVELSSTPIRDAAQEEIGSLVVIRDVTARQESERQRVWLLEAERAARSKLELVNRMKDDFLATLSHELRTPLNAILGWAQLLKRGARNTDERTLKGLEVIEANAKAQAQLIEDLLDMSRIVSGKVLLHLELVDGVEALRSAVETIRPTAIAKGVMIDMHAPEQALVKGDTGRLHQIFLNLLSNAVRFTPSGGRIDCRVDVVDDTVSAKVQDTGEGIDADFLPHVFDRFRQADASTKRKHSGLGIGLAIVQQLAHLHNGAVRAESAGLGKGATFTVTLPLAYEATSTEGALSTLAKPLDPCLQLHHLPLERVKVLVVDDEHDARDLVREVLSESGAEVVTAASANEGLELVKSYKPDVILSDIGMPERDGYEFIRSVRSLELSDGGATPAIALTAFVRDEDRVRALSAGFHSHISKPIEPPSLLAAITACARAKQSMSTPT